MQRASQLFSDEQRRQVDAAVGHAESKTSAELVPVVATASGRYDRAEDIVGLWFAILVAIATSILLPLRTSEAGSWGGIPLFWQIMVFIVGMLVAFIVGAAIASHIGWLRRLFAPRNEMRDDVAARAREVFFDKRIHGTSRRTGVLFYVSLFERMASVIADQQVIDKLGQPALDELCIELTSALHQGQPADALCDVLASAGNRLADVFPRASEDHNELSDALVTID